MSAKAFRLFAISAVLAVALAGAAYGQDFQKSYQLAAGSSIRISNVSGDVTVTGYDGATINVTGIKEGGNTEDVQIQDRSTGSAIDIGVHYAPGCQNCGGVTFQIQVPRSVNYDFERLHSVSGDVNVTGVTGRVEAQTVSGTVKVMDVAGMVNAKSVSGDVQVEMNRLEGTDDMSFSTVSGDVSVTAPASLDAKVEMSSFSGSLETSFPLQIEKDKFTSRQRATGQLGSGSRHVHISTVSGSVSLKQL